jgi:hypothetical protein
MAFCQSKTPDLGKFFEGLAIKDIGILLHGHLVYFTGIWSSLWPFSIFYGYLVYFSHFGVLHQENVATLL